jgi:hypothetical protein
VKLSPHGASRSALPLKDFSSWERLAGAFAAIPFPAMPNVSVYYSNCYAFGENA